MDQWFFTPILHTYIGFLVEYVLGNLMNNQTKPQTYLINFTSTSDLKLMTKLVTLN